MNTFRFIYTIYVDKSILHGVDCICTMLADTYEEALQRLQSMYKPGVEISMTQAELLRREKELN